MKINYFIGYLLSFFFLFTACKTRINREENTPIQEQQSRPNIVLMISDDHAYQAVSAYGYNLNKTPNIDRIAREGALFTRATVTNSLCAPSRAVILTGKHSFINGKVDNVQPFNWNQDNFAKELKKAGYTTALIGKIHLDGKPQGFDYSMVLPDQGHYYNPDFIINGEKRRIEGYVTDITTKSALKWLKVKRDKSKPFLLIYNQKAPHRNWKPALKYLHLYDDKNFTPPETYFDGFQNYPGRGTAAKTQEMEMYRDARWGHDFKFRIAPDGSKTSLNKELQRLTPEQRKLWDAAYEPKNTKFLETYYPKSIQNSSLKTPKDTLSKKELAIYKYNRFIKDYLRTIKSVDDGVGELLDYLKQNNLDKNTIVIYTSDQGFYLGEHGWFDKRFIYEQSLRTPLLIRYPKEIKPGTKINKLVQNLDFAPTILDYAGLEKPVEMQGESFRGLLNGTTHEWRDAVYYTYYQYPSQHMVKRHYGIVTSRYKLIHFYYDIDEWELYDLKKDPNELKNVYEDPSYRKTRNRLHTKLKELRIKYGDSDKLQDAYLHSFLDFISKK